VFGLPSGLFPSGFPTNSPYTFSSSSVLHAQPISFSLSWSLQLCFYLLVLYLTPCQWFSKYSFEWWDRGRQANYFRTGYSLIQSRIELSSCRIQTRSFIDWATLLGHEDLSFHMMPCDNFVLRRSVRRSRGLWIQRQRTWGLKGSELVKRTWAHD
jgi:hypothetical protein